MNKNQKIITFGSFPETPPPVPKVVEIRPMGSQILVELLTSQEVLGTNMIVNDQADVGSPQAYVLEIGPSLPKDWNLNVGDRILLQGSYVPVPKLESDKRRKGIIEVHSIKAILIEEKPSANTDFSVATMA